MMPPKTQDPLYARHQEYLRDMASEDARVLWNLIAGLGILDDTPLPELTRRLNTIAAHLGVYCDEFSFRLKALYR